MKTIYLNHMKHGKTLIDLSKHLSAIFFSAASLCIVAVYNQYPLFFNNDSAIYIETGFRHFVVADRPILYGLFIFVVSLGYSLWFVVIIQSLTLATMLYFYFVYFLNHRTFLVCYTSFIVFVSLLMGASFEASWIMADIFAPVCILGIGLFLFVKKLKTSHRIVLSMIYFFGVGVHNSHFFISIFICVIVTFGLFIKAARKQYKSIGIDIKKISFVVFLTIGGFFLSAFAQYMNGGGLKSSKGGSIFLLANMVELGIVEKFLSENCERKSYTLCRFKDSLPNNFLWDDNSPLNKTGGWEVNEKEYALIDRDILTTPKYLMEFSCKSVLYTFKQAFNYDMVNAGKTGKRARGAVGQIFPNEFGQFVSSDQYQGKLSFGLMNFFQDIIVGCCLCLYIIALLLKKTDHRTRVLMVYILLALIANATVCSIFSGVYPRYQTRVVFLLPLPLFLYMSDKDLLTHRLIKLFDRKIN